MIGVAGVSALRTASVAARFGRVWVDAGLRCDPGYAADLEVAFAAGTLSPTARSWSRAGTGATAGAVTDRRLTRGPRTAGWLLGDDGSGFWLGREAVRAALRTLDAGRPLAAWSAPCSANWVRPGRPGPSRRPGVRPNGNATG